MKGDDIAERLLMLTVGVLELRIRRRRGARHVAQQLFKAVTSGGANYAEARSAESRADFAHKVGLAAKELRETQYWLSLVRVADLADHPDLDALLSEATELLAILMASRRTARS
jgi:four helix bundle protein